MKLFADTKYFLYSEMMSGNFGAEYSISEGFVDYPDFSVGTSYTRLYGATDLNMSIYEVRVKVSKTFPAAFEAKFTPIFAYSFLNVTASSNRLGGYYDMSEYTNNNQNEPTYSPESGVAGDAFRFKKQTFNLHRFTVGVKIARGNFAFDLEGIIPFSADGAYNLNTGLSFIF